MKRMNETFGPEDDAAIARVPEAGIAEQMAGAQIDRLVETAKRWPRSLTRFRKAAIELATLDEETAASCSYAIPRGEKVLAGPSIRFAEIIAATYGNIWAQVTPVAEDDRFVTVRAIAWDVEANLCIAFDVRRRITGKDGRRYNDDMIGVTTAAASSIAYRNAVLRIVPEATTRHIIEAARQVVRGDAATIGTRLDKMLSYFAAMGVDAARVFAAVGVEGREDIGLDELETLRGFATAIKSEGASVDAIFPSPEKAAASPASRAEQVAARVSERKAAAEPAGEKADEPAPKPEEPSPAKTAADMSGAEFLASMGPVEEPDDVAGAKARLAEVRAKKGGKA